MCIAIVKTKDGKITDEQLMNCFESNPDGAGIAYSHDGKVYVVKGIFDCDKFLEEYHRAEELADGAMLIHCRISTSGHVDVTNCHPHVVNNECVMIHNGILNITVPKDSEVSDTVIFVRDLLAPLPQDFMNNEAIMGLITEAIGSTNKFAFLNYKGEYAIANEKAGHWKDGVWFSNYSYVSYKSFGKKSNYSRFDSCGRYSYGYGYDYDYDEDDDYGFGSEFDDDDVFVTPTAEEAYMIDVAIDELTDEELLLLGDNPLWACNQMWLTSDTYENKYEFAPVKAIKDFNDDLYEKYSARYWGMIARLYEYELTEDSFTETELRDIVCAYTTGRMNEADFSSIIESTALKLSENFVIDVDTRYWEAVDENPELEYTGVDDVIDVENIAEEELDYEDEEVEEEPVAQKKNIIPVMNMLNRKEKVLK